MTVVAAKRAMTRTTADGTAVVGEWPSKCDRNRTEPCCSPPPCRTRRRARHTSARYDKDVVDGGGSESIDYRYYIPIFPMNICRPNVLRIDPIVVLLCIVVCKTILFNRSATITYESSRRSVFCHWPFYRLIFRFD